MRSFIDQRRARFGVEPICNLLRVAPSAYWRHAARQRDPSLRSARAQRDEFLISHIERIWHANFEVYGADKVWRQLQREGIQVARCTVERLMRRLGLRGVMRGKVGTVESLELATLEWVTWFNHQRILGPLGYIPPAEAEQRYYLQLAEQAEHACT